MLSTFFAAVIIAPPIGPTLLPRSTEEVLGINHSVQVALSKGNFESAKVLLEQWSYGEIGYEFAGKIPDDVNVAEEMATKLWFEETKGEVNFVRKTPARVRIVFVESATHNAPAARLENGVWIAEIPRFIGNSERKNSIRGIAMGIAKAMGNSIGLASTERPSYTMGYDDYSQLSQPIDLKAMERKVLERLLSVRKTLFEAIVNRQTLIAAEPKMEISPTLFDAGNVKSGDVKKSWFAIKNDGNATLEFETHSSCSCVVLGEMRTVPPGKVLALEIGLDTNTMLGSIEKIVNFYSNAHQNTVQDVTMRAKAYPEYRIVPDDAQTVVLSENKPTVKEFYFYNMPLYPILVTDARTNKPGVKVEILPYVGKIFDPAFDKEPTSRVGTLIKLTFPANHPSGQDWTRLIIETDSLRMPKTEISIRTLKGLVVQPSSAYFGGVIAGQKSTRSITVSHPEFAFKILSHQVQGPFEVEINPIGTSGKEYRVKIDFVGNEKGLLAGSIEIRTDNPRFPTIKIPISGSAN